MNLAARIAESAAAHPAKVALDAASGAITYGEFDGIVCRLAGRLRRAGVATGDLVGIRMTDTPLHLAALVATLRVGGAILPLDWRASAPETARIVERFGPVAVVADDPRPLPSMVRRIGLDDIAGERPDNSAPVAIADAPLSYTLTSGTTGEPKGIVVTHEEMYARLPVFLEEGIMHGEDRFLPALPLAYAAGREFHLLLLVCGATVLMMPSLFDAADIARAVAERSASVLMVSPNVSNALLAFHPDGESHLFPRLRAYVSSTGRLTPETRAAIRGRLAPRLIDFYGSSGAGPIAAITGIEDETAPTSAGHLTSGLEVEIVDETGETLPAGAVGWIRMRGKRTTKRFVERTSGQGEGLRDDWYYPGDLGTLDRERRILHLHGRSADLIKRGGLMVHAQEVERVLCLHPAVAEAAVVGVPAEVLGEEVAAFVVRRQPVEAKALAAHCLRHLAPYKVPQRWAFIAGLPRNASGKVVKTGLGEPSAAAHGGADATSRKGEA